MRQLAAIVFADMTGFTAMMQENEHLANLRRRRMKEVLEATIEKYDGKILQYYGDGSLSIFNSAIQAVQSSVSIQQQLQLEPKVEMRIGIHTGDIIMEEETIYGDGVNLASRIESLAVPGGVFISEKVYDEIKNQENIRSKEMGYFELKNVKEPVRIFAIANDGLVVPSRDELRGKTKQPGNRLAVLPFVNMSADPENEYFSDGISEEILNALTKVNGLQVTSRTSAFAFKGKQDDVRDIAIKLNVDKILEGSVRKAGNRVRITTQLINAADGYHIWSETYDRNLTDIFEVQDEISIIIANRLRENLTLSQQETPLIKAPTKNIEAYTLYLKGVHYWNKLTPSDTMKAIEYMEKAIEMEPGYAQAYAMIAGAYSYLGALGQIRPDKAFPLVHEYCDKAQQLDDNIAEVYIANGSVYLFYEWKWDKAFACLQKARQLNPGLTEVSQLLGFYYIITGKKKEAVNVMKEAIARDPLSPIINHYMVAAFYYNEQYDDAIAQADKLLEMYPDMRATIELKGYSIGLKGDWEKALELFNQVHQMTGHPLKGVTAMGYAYGMLGQKEKALECIHKMEQRLAENPDLVLDGDLITVYTSLGDFDKAYYYMNQGIERRAGPAKLFLQDPIYQSLTDDARFAEMEKKLDG